MPSSTDQADAALSRGCLTLSTDSERGQVAALTAMLDRHGAYVQEFNVFDDKRARRFYVRCAFLFESPVHPAGLRASLREVCDRFRHAEGSIHDLDARARVLILASKADHCLRELLDQHRRGDLPMELVAVASNHLDLKPLVDDAGVPFHHLPISAETKPAQEAALLSLIESTCTEFVVLARYMQVLSDDLCRRLAVRVINIHHSFLPGFKGAKPYEQAWERGVKLIGATAHFATTDLDEGPIIEQSVERVDHADDPETLLRAGRHVESLVLTRALRFVLEHRVFVNGRRTVVLR